MKPTHTDQYLHWNSNHFTTAKHSIYNTIAHRAKMVSSDQQSLNKELEHIRVAQHNCHFPTWVLNKLQQKFQCRQQTNNEPNSTDQQNSNTSNTNGTNHNNSNNKNILHGVSLNTGIGRKIQKDLQQERHLGTFQGIPYHQGSTYGSHG